FTLPQTVKTHGIGAEFVDGVLSLTITKRSKALQKQYEVPISCGCNSMNCDCGVTVKTIEVEKSQIKGSHSCGCNSMNCDCGVTVKTSEVEKSQIKGSHSCGCTAMNCGCGI
ncbi:MAG TPA: Hsp20 family protein, partial [Gammaproteobacteria bacterium]|nr:Hsp20 family protein [Gammaproteobacteria bacterium]